MVSIQIWVTRFHVRCTGELEQGCLAALTGSPFFSTALESHVKFTAYDKRCFFFPEQSVVDGRRAGACCQGHPGLRDSPPGLQDTR